MHCRKMLLFFGNETCEKRSTENCFDVTMRSFNGAEICELAGLYIQSNIKNILLQINFRLHRGDGLILNGQQMDKKRKLSPKFSRTLVLVLTFKQILRVR